MALEIPEQVDRLPLEAVIHNETYWDYTNEQIEMIYKDKEERSDSIQFVKENNKETLAQVFTDVRYKKADNIYFSNMLLQVIEGAGVYESVISKDKRIITEFVNLFFKIRYNSLSINHLVSCL